MVGISLFCLAPLLILSTTVAAHQEGVLSLPFKSKRNDQLLKRDNTVTSAVSNKWLGYFINVTIGTPPQSFELQIDTGSTDVWIYADGACPSTPTYGSFYLPNCGGTYDESASSSSQTLSQGTFFTSYGDSSTSQGDLISDTLTIGNVALRDFTLGLAHQSNDSFGLLGLGFDGGESAALNQSNPGQAYPALLSQLVSQGAINTRAFSLYLDDLEQSTGTLLFGGYDSDKFLGNLQILPIIPTRPNENLYVAYFVTLDTIGISTTSGSYMLPSTGLPAPAILDSGTSFTTFPNDIFQQIVDAFSVSFASTEQNFQVDCGLVNTPGSIDFQFGGPGGPVVGVPFSEFIGAPSVGSNGEDLCVFGIQNSTEEGPGLMILGDTFLRSAYVVYDLDNYQIGIAQANYASTSSNIVAINNGTLQSMGAPVPTNIMPNYPSQSAAAIGPNLNGTGLSNSSLTSQAQVTFPAPATTLNIQAFTVSTTSYSTTFPTVAGSPAAFISSGLAAEASGTQSGGGGAASPSKSSAAQSGLLGVGSGFGATEAILMVGTILSCAVAAGLLIW